MRPSRRLFAAGLIVTGLVAVSLPAGADDTPNPVAAISSAAAALDPAAGASPSPSAAPTATAATAAPSVAAAPSGSATPSASAGPSGGNPLGGLPIPIPSNPVTDLLSCLGSAGADPAAYQKCLTDAGGGLGSLGGGGDQAKAVQDFLACLQKVGSGGNPATAPIVAEQCVTDLFTGLGIPQEACLNPTVNNVLLALGTLTSGDPSKLQAQLQDLPTTLPKQLQDLQACLTGATTTVTPSPSAGGAGTIESVAPTGAVSDPTTATPVSANPTFTG